MGSDQMVIDLPVVGWLGVAAEGVRQLFLLAFLGNAAEKLIGDCQSPAALLFLRLGHALELRLVPRQRVQERLQLTWIQDYSSARRCSGPPLGSRRRVFRRTPQQQGRIRVTPRFHAAPQNGGCSSGRPEALTGKRNRPSPDRLSDRGHEVLRQRCNAASLLGPRHQRQCHHQFCFRTPPSKRR